MAKVLLVEDDNNLREIYEARLQAEGYDTVTASDGEQALVVAKESKPDLVISDVMMPKISGFEMLDILRNTDGLKDVKVIMLTALGQSEDKTRADQLGANKYLVKSQVTLEDIVKSAHELLDDVAAVPPADAPAAAPATSDDTAGAPAVDSPLADPATPAAVDPVTPPAPAEPAPAAGTPAQAEATANVAAATTATESAAMQSQIDNFAQSTTSPVSAAPVDNTSAGGSSTDTAAASTDNAATPPTHDDQVLATAVDSLSTASNPNDQRPSEVTAVEVEPPAGPADAAPAPPNPPAEESKGGERVIQPLADPNPKPDINALLAAEESAENAESLPPATETITPTTTELPPVPVASDPVPSAPPVSPELMAAMSDIPAATAIPVTDGTTAAPAPEPTPDEPTPVVATPEAAPEAAEPATPEQAPPATAPEQPLTPPPASSDPNDPSNITL